MKSTLRLSALIVILCFWAACATPPSEIIIPPMDPDTVAMLEQELPLYPATRFIVFTDPHLYHPSLGTTGSALQEYLNADRKLLLESMEVMEEAVRQILEKAPQFVLVGGDMTKDGELVCHQLAANYMAILEEAGIPVYVVPGNHDVLNHHAFRYSGEETEPVPSVTPEQFSEIYAAYGFDEAVLRDPDSLSYVVEPVAGLWIVALDSCCYREQIAEDEEPIVDGKLYPETLIWLQNVLERSVRRNKAVLVLLHHQLMEHYNSEQKYYDNTIIDNYQEISKLLADYGVRLAFSGHDHAQDITMARWPENRRFLYDVGTGSLVTCPSPYRIVQIYEDQTCLITSHLITSIPSHPDDFQDYMRTTINNNISGIAMSVLRGYLVSKKSARLIAPQVAEAFVAHYIGDENPPSTVLNDEGVGLWGKIVLGTQKDLIYGLWEDLEPPDTSIRIDLRSGEWQ
jgi:3',5'-cyclic AMP phosphodiesterase CpdA